MAPTDYEAPERGVCLPAGGRHDSSKPTPDSKRRCIRDTTRCRWSSTSPVEAARGRGRPPVDPGVLCHAASINRKFVLGWNKVLVTFSSPLDIYLSTSLKQPPRSTPFIMYSTLVALSALAAVPLVYGQGVITSAQGTSGSPASLPLQILLAENDANIINQTEIEDNVTNECGRTLLGGNIDIGANTENQLANSTVTSVTKGSTVTVLISQGTTDGAGPYTCDLDLASNADGITGQTTLTVAETDGTDGTITLAVTMPSDLACVGASTGNVCTVRCKNTAAAGPFGGCFAVQQTDITAKANTPDNIETAQTLAGIQAQVLEDQADLPTTIEAISSSGGTDAEQGVRLADLLLDIDSAAQATVAIDATATATAAAEAVSTSSTKKSSTKTKTSTKTATSSASTSTKTSSTSSTKDTGKTATSSTKDKNKDDKDDKDKRDAAAVPGRSMRWGKRWVVVPSDKGEGN